MAPKVAKAGKRGGAGSRACFICSCGDMVYVNASHTCAGGGGLAGKASAKRATAKDPEPASHDGAPGAAAAAAAAGDKTDSDSDSEADRETAGAPTGGAPALDQILKLRSETNWALAFGKGKLRRQLMIVLQRKAKAGEIAIVKRLVVEDSRLPIHTYRFEDRGKHYAFEYFL